MKSALILSLVLVGACVIDSEPGTGADTTDTDPGSTDVAKITVNALVPASLYNSALTTSQLTSTNLQSMAATSDDRAALTYAVGCALSTSQSVSVTVGGTLYTFPGAMAVATAWTTRALTRTEASWVSSCVLARLNQTGTSVQISMRGAATGFATTQTELDSYKIEEGAFWGNVFTDIGTIAGTACNGIDQAHNDTYGDLPLRQCAQWDGVFNSGTTYCGLAYAGLCTSVCTTSTPYAGCGTPSATYVATTFLYGNPQ